jgi:hypothetical protein
MLAVVQHQQHLTVRQVGDERVEHRSDRLRNQQWVR